MVGTSDRTNVGPSCFRSYFIVKEVKSIMIVCMYTVFSVFTVVGTFSCAASRGCFPVIVLGDN